jgi:hypothetical protein
MYHRHERLDLVFSGYIRRGKCLKFVKGGFTLIYDSLNIFRYFLIHNIYHTLHTAVAAILPSGKLSEIFLFP